MTKDEIEMQTTMRAVRILRKEAKRLSAEGNSDAAVAILDAAVLIIEEEQKRVRS